MGEQIKSDKASLIKDMNFISAEEAWNSFQTDYFGEEADLAEGLRGGIIRWRVRLLTKSF